jgi:PAS domain-containing protein
LGLRERIKDLEAFESERKAIATELKGTRQRLQYLLAVSPAIIYTTKASGDYACTFVSENLRAIMGYTPQEMTTDPKGWPDHLHPDDARRAYGEMIPLIGRGGARYIAFATKTGTTFGSRTLSRSSMTTLADHLSLSAPGRTSARARSRNGLPFRPTQRCKKQSATSPGCREFT